MEKIKKHFTGFLLLLIAAFTFSCEENFLEVTDPNNLTPDTFWKTEADAVKGVTATYALFQYQLWGGRWGFYEGWYENMQCRSDLIHLADMWAPFGGMSRYEASPTSYVIDGFWEFTYQALYASNQVIENVPNVAADDATKQALIGEGKFLRAYAHFLLVNTFGNIVLVNSTPKSPDEFYKPQASQAEVWALIESDLQEAKSVLPDSYPAEWNGRATKGAATALLGKAYLFQDKWAQAASEFEAVKSMSYQLVDDYESLFTGMNEHSPESIFEINFTMSDEGGRNERNSFPAMMGPWKMEHPNEYLKNLYMNDLTSDGNFSKRVFGSIVFNHPESDIWYFDGGTFEDYYGADDTNVYWRKFGYYNSDNNNGYSWSHSGTNMPIIRYADVLLMLAEAQNEMGNTGEAINNINLVRERAGSTLITSMDQTSLREHIRHVERPLELAGECGRFFDLVRWYKNGDLKSVLQAHGREDWEKFDNGIDIYYPIPQSEVSANPFVTQNPGY